MTTYNKIRYSGFRYVNGKFYDSEAIEHLKNKSNQQEKKNGLKIIRYLDEDFIVGKDYDNLTKFARITYFVEVNNYFLYMIFKLKRFYSTLKWQISYIVMKLKIKHDNL